MIAASASIWIVCFAFRIGLSGTPYDTMDSAGRTMGFNDRFSAEHYSIALLNFQILRSFELENLYDWALFTMHVAAAILLHRFSRKPLPLLFFFAFQLALFPLSIVFLLYQPFYTYEIITLSATRESFIDVPFMLVMTQPPWLIVSGTITYLIFRRLRTAKGYAH